MSITPAKQMPLLFRLGPTPNRVNTRATALAHCSPYVNTVFQLYNTDESAVDELGITQRGIIQVYISPHAYADGFEEGLPLL